MRPSPSLAAVENERDYLQYDQYLAEGFPISSGVIEGTVRHLINDRMGITGAWWRLKTAEAVLRLRALISSGDFDAYWVFYEAQKFQRNHKARYKEGIVPLTSSTTKQPKLQIVK